MGTGIVEKKDRISKYLIPHNNEMLFGELSEDFLRVMGAQGILSGIPVPISEGENGQIRVSKIEIPHKTSAPKIDPNDIHSQIEIVIKEIEKGRGKQDIAEKYGIDPAAAEQIARLYLTHPGVTVDGIMRKMGL